MAFPTPLSFSMTSRLFLLATLPAALCLADPIPEVVLPSKALPAVSAAEPISEAELQRVYEEVRTPYKYGMVLSAGEKDSYVDCANVFRHKGRWYMVYVSISNKVGYETCLAESEDLLHWTPKGRILPFAQRGWDACQADGGVALFDTTWGGSNTLGTYKGRYWMSYFGGNKQGYEPDPLSIGMASTDDPSSATPWERHEDNPVMRPDAPEARPFEQETLYKSFIMHDPSESLGYPFIMYYNGKQKGPWIERIGMAYSRDLIHWVRPSNEGAVIDNLKGISGDPQITRMGDLWVMFYFGAGWKKGAFDTFAVSRDLRNWTKWNGPHLVSSSEPYDKVFAHKPWILKHEGVVYHFYCAVSKEGRGLALATSRDLRAPAVSADPASSASASPNPVPTGPIPEPASTAPIAEPASAVSVPAPTSSLVTPGGVDSSSATPAPVPVQGPQPVQNTQ